jgi:D-apionolactonase
MAGEASRAVKLCGTEQVDPRSRLLKAGALSAELENGQLRYVKFGGIEVLRAIAYLVRDENWGTFTPTIEDLKIDERPESFTVTCRATCKDDKRTLAYDARITGASDGSLSFEVVASPLTDVETNRTGFVVLHPVKGVAGAPLKVLHVDGREEISTFPANIDPDCPFRDIRALSHEVSPGVWAACTMEGDTFEMEDHRNWSDASYKTYVRPLARPWPYTLQKGVKVEQAVRLRISGTAGAASESGAEKTVAVRIGDEAGRMPAIGLGVPAEEAEHALQAIGLVKQLGPKWLICQVDLRQGHGAKELALYRRLGEEAGAEIVLEIVTTGGMDPAGDLMPLGEAARTAGLTPAAIAVFPAEHMKSVLPGSSWPVMPSFEEIYGAARAAFPGVRLGGGMATYFTELNRKRPPANLLDYVTHTTCPNVHASDDRSVMETLEALLYQIQSTRAFMGDALAYRVGPSQLASRENPYGKTTTPNPSGVRACLSRIDPRQRGLLNAAWTLGYVAALARGGLEAAAMGAPTGPFGHIYRRTDFPQAWFDEAGGAPVYPSFHVVAGLARLSGKPLLRLELEPEGAVDGIAVRDGDKTVLWLANLGTAPQTVMLPGATARAAVLDESTFERAATDPNALHALAKPVDGGSLRLDAYAVARCELA